MFCRKILPDLLNKSYVYFKELDNSKIKRPKINFDFEFDF